MKEAELRSLATCRCCRKKIGATKIPFLFYKITAERFGIDRTALERQAGLEMMMNGHVGIARALSPDEDMAKQLMEQHTFMVCEQCTQDNPILMRLFLREE